MRNNNDTSVAPIQNVGGRLWLSALISSVVMGGVIPNIANAAGVSALEEIVVTARKREESAQDVPIAMTSFSSEGLKQQGASNMEGLSFHTPNLMFTTSSGSDSTLKPSIRGQSQNDNVATLDQSVGIYVDDVIWARPLGVRANLSDIERVEVLRGPQGTLFGRNTTGGAIVIHTKDPVFETEGKVGLRLGNYSRSDYSLVYNTPIIDDILAFRVAVDAQKRDGWQKGVNYDQMAGEDDSQNYIVKLLYTPADNLSFLLKVDRSEGDFRQRGQIATGLVDGVADPYTTVDPTTSIDDFVSDKYDLLLEGDVPSNYWKNEGVSLTTQWDINDDLSVKVIGAYRAIDAGTNQDLDGSPVPVIGTNIALTGYEMKTLEMQLNGSSFDGDLDWTLGAYYFEEGGRDESKVRVGQLLAFNILQNTVGETDNQSQAIFAQGIYALTDELSLTLGVRYSEEEKNLVSKNSSRFYDSLDWRSCMIPDIFTGGTTATTEAECRAEFSRDDESLDYTIMLSYSYTDAQMVYFKAASGFRSGGQNLRGGAVFGSNSVGSIGSYASFAPEEVVEYEVGLKADLLEGSLRTNIAYFLSDYSDIQRSTLVPGTTSTFVSNAASATVQGIEAEITAIITDNWQLGTSVGWIDAEYDEFMSVDSSGNPIDRSNEPFVATPEYSFSAWTSYYIPLSVGDMTARVDYSWSDEHYAFATTVTKNTDTPAKGVWNGRLQWDVTESLEMALWGKNLTDERYRVYGIDVLGLTNGIGNEPRTWGIDVNYSFGG